MNLIDACIEGNIERVKELIASGVALDDRLNEKERYSFKSALHIASSYDYDDIHNTEMVSILLEGGANINIEDYFGDTPLHIAVSNNKYDVVELLIISGADVNYKNKVGRTPLHEACSSGFEHSATLIIDAGADVNIQDMYGKTPLDITLILVHYNQFVRIERILKQNGAVE